jgi:cytochrome c-type biogenesis protein CcmF
MIPELGHFGLALAVVLAAAQAILPLWGASTRDRRLMGAAPALAIGQFIAVGAAFICLVWSAVSDDFSVLNVAENSATVKPLLYKITGAWGDHEGSILLWCLILALCGAAVAGFGRTLPLDLRARVLGVLGAMSVGFLLFALTVSDPFVRLWPPPLDGRDMNPLFKTLAWRCIRPCSTPAMLGSRYRSLSPLPRSSRGVSMPHGRVGSSLGHSPRGAC